MRGRGDVALRLPRRAAVLMLALILDAVTRELPNELHPVAWLGRLIGALSRKAPRSPAAPALLAGGAIELAAVGAASVGGLAAERLAARLPRPLAITAEAYLLKQALALRALLGAAEVVRRRLDSDDLPGAQAALLSLVSRDRDLPAPLVAAAAVESVAENCCDSVVAPLLAYALGGLPAACAYRAANTADAMLGYRDEWEYLGKVAARVDDLANLAPARLTALALTAMAAPLRSSGRGAWRVMLRDHGLTASPNAGWTMSAAAGALGVALEKRGAYRLNDGAPDPSPADIRRAQHLACAACLAVAAALAAATALMSGRDQGPGAPVRSTPAWHA